jgi:hypothetical protein
MIGEVQSTAQRIYGWDFSYAATEQVYRLLIEDVLIKAEYQQQVLVPSRSRQPLPRYSLISTDPNILRLVYACL